MCVLMHQLWPSLLLLTVLTSVARAEDICRRCQCLPFEPNPTQAICHDDGSADKTFSPTTTEQSASLELVYIYGIRTVNFRKNSLKTSKPVTLLIQNCSEVFVADRAVARLQTLLIKDVAVAQVGRQPPGYLWATVLEDIGQLTVGSSSLWANYSVTIGHVRSLILEPSGEEVVCNENTEFTFSLIASRIKPIPKGGLSVCGGSITLNSNTFESVSGDGFQLASERSIAVVNNNFNKISKEAFNLTAPEIYITGNHFEILPAGALRSVSTLQDTYFTNNTIADVDLGGVLLDMGWDMVIEQNIVDCDCAFKRTSILNPKQDMLYLTNSSLEKLHNIFLNNFCNLNCSISLKTFSYALAQGEVCVANDTKLEQDILCHITVSSESTTTDVPDTTTSADDMTTSDTETPSVFSSASKTELFLIPISLVILTILITSSVCYGCKEMNTFKFTFNPHREASPKIPLN